MSEVYRAKITTLCYIHKDGKYLMLFRNKKQNDENEGKWIGIGGKLMEGESPDECICREVAEETGLTLTEFAFRGVITFISDTFENEYMMLYEASDFDGECISACPEGELAWVEEERLFELPMWEGDRLFLEKMLSGREPVMMKLTYQGDRLVKWD